MEWVSGSPAQTRRLGVRLGRLLQKQDVVALIGEIGAGKTTFVQGVAQGLGVPEQTVASPSFVLVREYHGRFPLYHADLFRLEGMPEAETVGLEEHYEGSGATVIEWANRIPEVLPKEFLEIRFEVLDPKERRLHLIPHGSRYQARLAALKGSDPAGSDPGQVR